MAFTFLENKNIPALRDGYKIDDLARKYETRKQKIIETKENDFAQYHAVMDDVKKAMIDNEKSKVQDETHLRALDFDAEDLQTERLAHQKQVFEIKKSISDLNTEIRLLNRYKEQFALLKQIYDDEEAFGEGVKVELQEIMQSSNEVMPQENYYAGLANGGEGAERLALHIQLPEGPEFDLSIVPYDTFGDANIDMPEDQEKPMHFQLSMEEEEAQNLSAENWARIIAFCEAHGLPSYAMDLPYSGDGNLTLEKFENLLNELKKQVEQNNERRSEAEESFNEKQQQWEEEFDKESALAAVRSDANETGQDSNPNPNKEDKKQSPLDKLMSSRALRFSKRMYRKTVNFFADDEKEPEQQKIPASGHKEGEKVIETLLSEGLGKRKGLSYFKTGGRGIIGNGWTIYTVFDSENSDNMLENGRKDDKGKAKFTYAYKIFVGEMPNGELAIMYHVRENKKLDPDVAGGIAGKFKDLKYTHVSIPGNIPDCDKKTWRIALAEKGIVPIGMSLDKSKAAGMISAAKEKLSAEDFARFSYNLALQMEEDNRAKGKKIPPSEKDYIESLKSNHQYSPFVDGYNNVVKPIMRKKLLAANDNFNDGVLEKIAAYSALNRLFDVYNEQVGMHSLEQSAFLSADEKRRIGAVMAHKHISALSAHQLGEVYQILFERCKKEAKVRVDKEMMEAKDTENVTSKGAKRADSVILRDIFNNTKNGLDNVNDELSTKGCEEIAAPKVAGFLYYDQFYDEHPEFLRKKQNNNSNNNTNTNNSGGQGNENQQNSSSPTHQNNTSNTNSR